MRRASPFLLLMVFALPAWCARQSGQSPPASPPSSSSSSSSKPSQTQPQTQPREIATFDPPNAENDVEIGNFYLHKGDANAAIPRFQEAVQLKPKYAKARLLLAEAYEKTHDKDDAVKTYQDYLKAFPNAPDATKIQKKIEKMTAR
jgi:cytochrome c-type biogenesis protein CcmH/NrfG